MVLIEKSEIHQDIAESSRQRDLINAEQKPISFLIPTLIQLL